MPATAPPQAKSAPRVPAAAAPVFTAARSLLLQRKCACGGSAGSEGECEECRKKKVLRRRAANTHSLSSVPPIVNEVLSSPGHPLDAGTRAFMESRFGHDFSQVRVHDDALAAESARAVNARAYTVGRDIAFASGQYQASTPEGAALLAHELAHTVQQGSFHCASVGASPIVASENDSLEREAASAASAVVHGDSIGLLSRSPAPALSRAPWGDCVGTKQVLNKELGEDLKEQRVAAGQTKAQVKAAKAKKPGYFTFEVAEAAEDIIAGYFKQKRGEWAHINKDPVLVKEVSDPESEEGAIQSMVNEAYDEFRSGGSKRKKAPKNNKASSTPDASSTAPKPRRGLDPVGAAIEQGPDDIKAAMVATPAGAQLKPDCVDFKLLEVYDVTTTDGAKEKVNKLEGYRKLYETIRANVGHGGEWKIGKSLTAPPKLTYGHPKDSDPIKICFGVTDFATYPGVLAYTVVDTGPIEGSEKTVTREGKVERVDYQITAGSAKATLKVPETFANAKNEVVPIEGDPDNSAASTLIKGFVLTELRHKSKAKNAPDIITARIDATGTPLALDQRAKPVTLNVSAEGGLTLDPASKKLKGLPFDYKFLSFGEITSVDLNDAGGVDWTGVLKPSIPFLGRLDVVYKRGELAVTKDLKPADLKPPFPGVRIKEAGIGLKLAPTFVPEGKLLLQFGADEKPLAEAALKVTTDGVGIVVDGLLRVFIPGVDKAEANVVYKGGGAYGAGGWTGLITIESSQIKLPYIESGAVTVQLVAGKGAVVDGQVNLALPGENKATVGLRREEKAWIFTGGGRFKVPKIGPVDVLVRYNTATQLLIASAKNVKFEMFGVQAKLDSLTGEIAPGVSLVVYGSGGAEIKKGKVTGHVDLKLNRNGLFTGKGAVSYRFNDKLTANAGVELDDKQRLKFSGQLVTSLHLFDKFGNEVNLFNLDINIPIPGASIGGVGLEATVGGGVDVGYSVGPGEVSPLILSADFYPLEENADLSLAVSGMVRVPASVYLKAHIFGGIILSVFIAEIGGKIVLTGTITLTGGLFAPFQATYKGGKIEASLTPEIKAALLLGLALDLTAWAKAGVGWLSVKTEKTWNLARREIDTGLGFSLKAPIEYSTERGVKFPSVKDIDLKKPDISKARMKEILRQLVEGSDPKEREV
jgi:hypothetical protein